MHKMIRCETVIKRIPRVRKAGWRCVRRVATVTEALVWIAENQDCHLFDEDRELELARKHPSYSWRRTDLL